jgi:hypothetical protein
MTQHGYLHLLIFPHGRFQEVLVPRGNIIADFPEGMKHGIKGPLKGLG